MKNYGEVTEIKIQEVMDACRRYGDRSIIALSGVPGTGKSFVALIAAQRLTNEPLFVREIQFHQTFSYEEFLEGLRIDSEGAVNVSNGVFLEWNNCALADPEHTYVLLIEEFTRANISAVLGEVMTYVEYRDRQFLPLYSKRPTRVAKNLIILTTFNPSDRSAIDIDSALLRRLRIISFPPSDDQLDEMLGTRGMNPRVVDRLKKIFTECRIRHKSNYEYLMPFGHGVFADIKNERPDLHQLWVQRLVHFLKRPLHDPHAFSQTIEDNYPWKDPNFTVNETP